MAISEMWEVLEMHDSRNVGQLVEGTKEFEVTAVVRKTKYGEKNGHSLEPEVVTFRCDYKPNVCIDVYGRPSANPSCEVYQTSLPNGKKCFRKSMSPNDRASVVRMVRDNWRKVTNFRELYLKQNPEVTRTKWDLPEGGV
tara:strand:+ start:628 stop:1047 length:420 start_codon:yes stop_codon:yes gene_type:complete